MHVCDLPACSRLIPPAHARSFLLPHSLATTSTEGPFFVRALVQRSGQRVRVGWSS